VPVKAVPTAVTVYKVMGAPPSLEGAVKVTVASPVPAVAVTDVGAAGTVAGVMGVSV
jgi:hypothetical protein